MNSRQRRKDARLWQHRVVTNNIEYYEYSNIWDWVSEQYGKNEKKCGWRDRVVYNDNDNFDVVWEFVKEKQAVEFTLRWAQ
jgi:hypothetical protein